MNKYSHFSVWGRKCVMCSGSLRHVTRRAVIRVFFLLSVSTSFTGHNTSCFSFTILEFSDSLITFYWLTHVPNNQNSSAVKVKSTWLEGNSLMEGHNVTLWEVQDPMCLKLWHPEQPSEAHVSASRTAAGGNVPLIALISLCLWIQEVIGSSQKQCFGWERSC